MKIDLEITGVEEAKETPFPETLSGSSEIYEPGYRQRRISLSKRPFRKVILSNLQISTLP